MIKKNCKRCDYLLICLASQLQYLREIKTLPKAKRKNQDLTCIFPSYEKDKCKEAFESFSETVDTFNDVIDSLKK